MHLAGTTPFGSRGKPPCVNGSRADAHLGQPSRIRVSEMCADPGLDVGPIFARNCSYEDVFILLQLACVLLAGPCPRPVIWKQDIHILASLRQLEPIWTPSVRLWILDFKCRFQTSPPLQAQLGRHSECKPQRKKKSLRIIYASIHVHGCKDLQNTTTHLHKHTNKKTLRI